MRLFAVICTVLLALSAPALAQDADGGSTGVSPGMLALGVAGVGLGVFAGMALKKNSTTTPPTPLTCAQLLKSPWLAATEC